MSWQNPSWRPDRRHARGWPGGAVIAAGLFHVLGAHSDDGTAALFRPLGVLGYALLVIGPLALFWRRSAPIVVLAVASAASIGFAAFAALCWMFAVAPIIALFTAAKAGRRAAILVAALVYAGYLLVGLVFAGEFGIP